MKDTELFELCKEVYKRTGWNDTKDHIFDLNAWPFVEETKDYQILPAEMYPKKFLVAPLYTSDYLLEKLPKGIKGNYLNMFNAGISSWYALYGRTTTAKETGLYGEADTPLKALLKLTIALDNAKELPHDN